jgi:hypothetical protein
LGISDISDQILGGGAGPLAKGIDIAIRKEERFIAQTACDGKAYLTPQTAFGMREFGQA